METPTYKYNSALAPLRLRQSGASVMALAGSSYPDDKTFGHARMRLILEDMCADRDASFLPFTSKKYHRLHENERGSDGATARLKVSTHQESHPLRVGRRTATCTCTTRVSKQSQTSVHVHTDGGGKRQLPDTYAEHNEAIDMRFNMWHSREHMKRREHQQIQISIWYMAWYVGSTTKPSKILRYRGTSNSV